jgi:hypothetical protein
MDRPDPNAWAYAGIRQDVDPLLADLGRTIHAMGISAKEKGSTPFPSFSSFPP